MSGDRTPLTLLGLDGVSWELVDELVENAEVPTLASLVDRAVTGVTDSTVPSLTCPALPVLYTGINPGNLGIFDFVKPNGDIVDYHDVTEPGLWDYLGERDVSMVVGAMRTTHPAPPVDGVFISDVLSPREEPQFVTPGTAREAGERFHRMRDDLEAAKKSGDDEQLLRTFIEFNDERADVLLELLEEHDPAFALLWFGLTDGVQHYFWNDREGLYEFFERFDERLAELLAARDGNLLVVGDHGFGPAISHRFHLNDALYRGGYLSLRGGRAGALLTKLAYRASESYVSDQWKRRALALVNAVQRGTGGDSNGESGGGPRTVVTPLDSLPGIDWSRTRAHLSTRKGWGINLVDRNVTGDRDALRREIIDYLQGIEAPNGKPAVKDAWFGEEVYWGRYGDQIPDIVFLANDEVRPRPSVVGRLFTPRADGSYVGSHESSREAVLMVDGPDVTAEGSVGHVDLYDVLPTVLHLLGEPVPENVDGDAVAGLTERPVETASYPVERYRVRSGVRAIPSDGL